MNQEKHGRKKIGYIPCWYLILLTSFSNMVTAQMIDSLSFDNCGEEDVLVDTEGGCTVGERVDDGNAQVDRDLELSVRRRSGRRYRWHSGIGPARFGLNEFWAGQLDTYC